MPMIVIALPLDAFGAEVGAHRREDGADVVEHGLGEHTATGLGHKDHMTLPVRTMLAYKRTDCGGKLVEVPVAYTSQACACCGHRANADTTAAITIRRRVEACGRALPQAVQ